MTVWMHSHLQLVIMNMQLLKGGLKETYGLCGMSPENIASITGKDLDEINAILEGKVPVLL
ncbi:hypothetical protein ACTQ32_16085 [Roseburia faecis]|uniref:hypothetical protein n=1 Tax=Roseburia faecis TaxID=301302 RepID=UPI003F956115